MLLYMFYLLSFPFQTLHPFHHLIQIIASSPLQNSPPFQHVTLYDYFYTHSLLALACINHWFIHHFNVNNVFLHGEV